MTMRRVLLVPPVLMATGCVTEASTPALTVAAWATDPDTVQMRLPSRDDALRHWQLPPSDPWSPYSKYTLMTALDVVPEVAELPDPLKMDEVRRSLLAGEQLGTYGFPPDVMFVVDMRGAASVAFGVGLSRTSSQPVSLVPTFNNWPGDDELVPAEETLAALSTMWPADPQQYGVARGRTSPVFLLDAWRLAYRFDEPGEDTYDNRYVLTPSDLPDAATLQARGIRRVVYVVGSRDDTTLEEDDVHYPFMEWQAAGIPIAMVDVYRLGAPVVGEQWDELFAADLLLVQPRRTILDNPTFFILARGGFGGVYAHPSPLFRGGWHAGGGRGFGGGWHGGGG
jgi:hypothetical protein